MGKLEDFLNNVPLSIEAEEAREEAPDAPHATGSLSAEEIAEDEAAALRAAYHSPLWPILIHRLRSIVTDYELTASILSQTNPLANKDAVANAWAYTAIAKEIEALFILRIQAEVVEAERQKQ